MQIDYKSTGTLINELITTRLKIQNIGAKAEFVQRAIQLTDAITARGKGKQLELLVNDINELSDVLTKLWWEQEVLYEAIKNNSLEYGEIGIYLSIAQAGINSLKLNKQRSDLIRKIDTQLGETSSTVLEKSWR